MTAPLRSSARPIATEEIAALTPLSAALGCRHTRTKHVRPLLIVTLFAIAYGSLYPFELASTERALRDALALRLDLSSGGREDVVSNFVLFVPVGLLSALGFRASLSTIVGGGAVYGLFLQLGQLFIVGRVPAFGDVVWNSLGMLAGAALARSRSRFFARIDLPAASFPLILGLCWLTYNLFPFVPTYGWNDPIANAHALLTSQGLDRVDLLRNSVGWFVFAAVASAVPKKRNAEPLLVMLVGGVLLAQIGLVQNATPANVVGTGLAIAGWLAIRASRFTELLTLSCLAATTLVLGLEPFTVAPAANPFHLLPFYGFLQGSMFITLQQLFLKLFLYGSLIWLGTRVGWTLLATTVATALLLLAIELAQTLAPARTPESADPLIALFAAWLLTATRACPTCIAAGGAAAQADPG